MATEGVGIKPARRPGSSWQISEQSSRSRRRSARRFGILFANVGVGIKPALCRGAPQGPGRPGWADGPAGPGPPVPDPMPPINQAHCAPDRPGPRIDNGPLSMRGEEGREEGRLLPQRRRSTGAFCKRNRTRRRAGAGGGGGVGRRNRAGTLSQACQARKHRRRAASS